MNWRVVITVANSRAPKVLMVWLNEQLADGGGARQRHDGGQRLGVARDEAAGRQAQARGREEGGGVRVNRCAAHQRPSHGPQPESDGKCSSSSSLA